MELLSVIRRWHYRDHFSIREISRRTGLSRNTVRKYLRSDTVEPKFNIPDRPSKLDPYADKLSQMLRQEAGKSRKQKRTTKQLHADLAALGYDGSYNRVAAFARDWKAARQQEQKTCGRGVFVPLAFLPGEAFQFDWSEDWAIIAGERTKLQVAHVKLSYSRAFILRAYPQQTHEMLFDAHNHAFRVLGGVPRRGIYDNMRTAVDKVGRGYVRVYPERLIAIAVQVDQARRRHALGVFDEAVERARRLHQMLGPLRPGIGNRARMRAVRGLSPQLLGNASPASRSASPGRGSGRRLPEPMARVLDVLLDLPLLPTRSCIDRIPPQTGSG